ncbi:MAG: hypothetical protein ACD_4C00022G0001 [uncultured bacterium (gcode 4)]|uniref:Uncharacterized protein n=1 Tax=uncultured bacterium (gcode 4) TaxID=1234023 RepID=K2FW41_9BACT|nr:MAG: hypothetical protein ACD_4C00022G0001 [uncultured bacterium (gcode 4)]
MKHEIILKYIFSIIVLIVLIVINNYLSLKNKIEWINVYSSLNDKFIQCVVKKYDNNISSEAKMQIWNSCQSYVSNQIILEKEFNIIR